MSAIPRDELAAAAEWRLLSLLLSRPRPGWRDEVAAVAGEVADRRLRAAADASADATEGAYHALLGAGGVASPREAAHAGFLDPGRILADLAGRYGAFAFAPRAEEPDDHLAVECDFVSYLFLKEAFALARGEREQAAVSRGAREEFLAEHVAVAGHRFAARLPPGAPAYLSATAAALVARLPEAPPCPQEGSQPAAPEEDPLEGGCPGCA